MVHKEKNLVKIFQMRLQANGLNHGGNFIVKHAQDGVVLGQVTSQEVPMLHCCEHHLDPMSVKYSIYFHEIYVYVNHYS